MVCEYLSWLLGIVDSVFSLLFVFGSCAIRERCIYNQGI